MSRWFFDQVDDELRGLVGPGLRSFQTAKNGRLLKVWFGDPSIHFEAQWLSESWSPSSRPAIEIGLHLESRSPERNREVLGRLLEGRKGWQRRLAEAEAGPAFGPQGAAWRRLSELVELDDLDEDLAGEVAERLACYVVTLQPLIEGL